MFNVTSYTVAVTKSMDHVIRHNGLFEECEVLKFLKIFEDFVVQEQGQGLSSRSTTLRCVSETTQLLRTGNCHDVFMSHEVLVWYRINRISFQPNRSSHTYAEVG